VAQAYSSFVIGRYNVVEGNMTDWIVTDPLFVIGYGQSHSKANALTVLKNGYVGIGTSAPTEKLHTTGGVRFAGYTGTGIRLLTVDPDGNISTTGGTSNKNITWDATNGRLGIGITTPTRTLHLYNSTADGQLLIQRYTNTLGDAGAILFKSHISTPTGYEKGGIFFETTNTAYGYGSLHFATNNTASTAAVTKADARMTIASNGYIGINDISPTYYLDVNGTGRFVNDVYLATTSGNVGIGKTSTTYKLDVTGIIRSTLSSYFATSSGSVGVGTTSPGNFKLYVQSATGGASASSGYFLNTATDGIAQISRTNSTDGTALLIQEGTGYSLRCDAYDPSWFVAMIVKGRNVGINTSTPDKNLHVVGDARITGSIYYGTGTSTYTKPDFVFDDDYKNYFEPLEVEAFLQSNGHLPWLTSVKDEKDGINLTRMQFETLETVENLQLQIIEIKKDYESKLKKLEEKIKEYEDLKAEIELLKKNVSHKEN
jgi:hypothetical protein